MLKIQGHDIANLPFGELTPLHELLEMEGRPVLIHLTNEKHDDILAYWVDYEKETTRWIYAKIQKTNFLII